MKKPLMKQLALLLSICLLLSACTSRSPAPSLPQEEAPASSPESPAPEEPAQEPDTPAQEPAEEEPEEKDPEKEEEPDEESKDDNAGEPASGTFTVLDSGYEITLASPFLCIYDSASNGLYLSAIADNGLKGLVSYTEDQQEVQGIENNVTALNETLKNDTSVHDFSYDRQREANGLYTITFSYRTEEDEVSSSGYNYVLYRRTEDGMITVMFTSDTNAYADPVKSVFASVQKAGDKAVAPPSR